MVFPVRESVYTIVTSFKSLKKNHGCTLPTFSPSLPFMTLDTLRIRERNSPRGLLEGQKIYILFTTYMQRVKITGTQKQKKQLKSRADTDQKSRLPARGPSPLYIYKDLVLLNRDQYRLLVLDPRVYWISVTLGFRWVTLRFPRLVRGQKGGDGMGRVIVEVTRLQIYLGNRKTGSFSFPSCLKRDSPVRTPGVEGFHLRTPDGYRKGGRRGLRFVLRFVQCLGFHVINKTVSIQ